MSNQTTRIKLLVVDDSDETRASICKLLSLEDDIEVIGEANNGRDAVKKALELRPHVILMDVRMPELDGFGATEALVSELPAAQIILMSVAGTAEYFRKAMLVGAREFLVKPFEPEEMVASVRRAYELHPGDAEAVTQEPPPPVNDAAPNTDTGTLIAVFGPKGGVGRTTVACNLACALAGKEKARVALVDGCLRFGDVGMTMNLPNDRSIGDLASVDPSEVDLQMIEGTTIKHQTGVHVLLAPPTPEQGELVTTQGLRHIIAELKQAYDYVVVDLSPALADTDLAVLDAADKIVLLFTLELTALRNVKQFLDLAKTLDYSRNSMVMVANRVDEQGGVRLADVEGSLHFKTAVCLRNDPNTATLALNKGTPFVLSRAHTGIAQSVEELARLVTQNGGDIAESVSSDDKAKKGKKLPFLSSRAKAKETAA